jgi:hypothetical protein
VLLAVFVTKRDALKIKERLERTAPHRKPEARVAIRLDGFWFLIGHCARGVSFRGAQDSAAASPLSS